MQPAQSKSKTKFIVIAIVVVAVVAIIGGAAYAVVRLATNNEQKQTETTQQQTTDTKSGKEVTQQTLNEGVSQLNETVKETKSAHFEAEKAVDDASRRVKVSQ